jgi:hypothetical protein
MAKKTFILSDESLNAYGFWVSTEGIDTAQFERNPVMLWGHHRTWRGTDDEILPIGRWENVRKENGKLLADAVFDENDPFAKRIADKVEGNFLRMTSIGMVVVDTSADPVNMKPGQTREAIVKCRLREASIVDIGANDNALVLYDLNGELVNLSASSGDMPVQLLEPNGNFATQPLIHNSMKILALALGLKEDATEAEILQKMNDLKAEAAIAATLRTELDGLRATQITALVDAALAARKFTADKKEHFLSLGKSAGVDVLRSTLDCMQPEAKPLDGIRRETPGDGIKKFAELTADERMTLRNSNPEEYRRLYREEYGIDCKL